MSTNSRFPIDLAALSVVGSGYHHTAIRILIRLSRYMRSRFRAALVLVLTIGLLAFFFRGVDFAGVWAETRRADPRLLVAAVGVTLMTYVFRAFRWQYLLAPIGPT